MNLNIHAYAIRLKNVKPSQGTGSISLNYLLIMKLILFLTIGFSLQVSGNAVAQNITLSVKGASFKTVLQTMQRQSGYSFIIASDQVEQAKPVTLDIKDKNIKEVLPQLFNGQPFSYEINGKLIKVLHKTPPIHIPLSPIQQQTIRGRVTDSLGNPLQGVTVQVKESGWQTMTDPKGRYEITGVYPTETLHFRLLSYQTFETPANRPEINVTLRLLYSEIEEVDISLNTGYQSIPKERATGSFVQIDNEALNRRVSTDLISRLEGITSGLLFNRNLPNNSSESPFSIRGRSTIFANTKPLIILDNFPFDGDLNSINPNDIENITVLRDAAAASIWGVQSGNGVIVVNTKKGKLEMPLRISVNSNLSFGSKPNLFYDQGFLNSTDYIDAEIFLFTNGYFDAAINNSTTRPALSQVVELLAKQRNGNISIEESQAQINALQNIDIRNDISNYYYKNSLNQQYSINLNGGSSKITYFFSAGYDKNSENRVGNNFERISLNIFNSYHPTKRLEFSSGLMFTQTNSQINNQVANLKATNVRQYAPYTQLSDDSGHPTTLEKDYRFDFINETRHGELLDWTYRPLEEINLADHKFNYSYLRVTPALKYTFFDGLNIEIKHQFEKSNSMNREFQNEESYFTRNLINLYTQINGEEITRPIPNGGILDQLSGDLIGNTFRTQLNFNHVINNHSISAIGGAEFKELKQENIQSRLYGFNDKTSVSSPVDYTTSFAKYEGLGSRGTIPYQSNINGLIDEFSSYFINAAYSYKDRYTISSSGRMDRSNLFGVASNNKSVPLWSLGFGWHVSKEPFFKILWLPYLKFRSTFGYNGNIDKTVSAYTTASYSGSSRTTGAQQLRIINPANPQLRWEKLRTINVGVDFTAYRQYITGSFDYYNKVGIDLLGYHATDPTTGFLEYKGNVANIKGEGWDLELKSSNIHKRLIKWSTILLISHNKEIVSNYQSRPTTGVFLQRGDGSTGNIAPLEGFPVFSIAGYKWAGLDHETGNPIGYINGDQSVDYSGIVTGSVVEDLSFYGSARPTWFGGLRNDINIKDFSFSFNVTFKMGYYFRRTSINYNSLATNGVGHLDFSSRWRNAGDESHTDIPSFVYPLNSSREFFYQYSETLIERGDFIRLQDIQISYDFVRRNIKYLPVKGLQVYAYVNNVGIIWRSNRMKIDPDFINGMPQPSTYAFGIKFKID